MKFRPLPRDFYNKDTVQVSQNLLGHFLLHRIGDVWCGGEIVETEAYVTGDPASHAFVRETPRNRIMYGAPGHAYIYRIYGAHFCFNAVCREAGVAEAVLIRAIEPRFGLEAMKARRSVDPPMLTNGPGKLCQALGITLAQDGADIAGVSSSLIIARNPNLDEFVAGRAPVVTTTRIGLTKAADWLYRWYLDGSPHVSRRVPRPRNANAKIEAA